MLKENNEIADWCAGVAKSKYRGVLHIQAEDEAQALLCLSRLWALLDVNADSQARFPKADSSSFVGLKFVACTKESGSKDSEGLFTSAPPLHINQARSNLGKTQKLVVFNMFQGLNPNIFAMLAGSIQGGGLLVLLSPLTATWHLFDDPDYQKLTPDTDFIADKEKLFLKRGAQLFELLALHKPQYYLPVSASNLQAASITIEPSDNPLDTSDATPKPVTWHTTQQQAQLISQLTAQLFQAEHSLSCSVIEGARGRGKSTCIGLYLSSLLKCESREGDSLNIVVTAIHRNAVESVFSPFSQGHLNVRFMPIDELLTSADDIDILVVDEAAAISTQLLKKCLSLPRQQIIFSTTTAGYEGNGRGFSIRFTQYLKQHIDVELLQFMSLNLPIRYAANDMLEQLIDDWFLLDSSESTLNITLPLQLEALNFVLVTQEQLSNNALLLQRIFSLLLESHYQTSADDARFILDYPNLVIAVACVGELQHGNIIAASLLVHEGSFDADTCNSFAQTPRRLRGHILPQQLSNTSSVEWLKLPFLRVVRIAVLHEFRYLGLGRQLLETIEGLFPHVILGASFALSDSVLSFWLASGFQLMQLGTKAESSTGNVSGVVLKLPADETMNTSVLQRVWKSQELFCEKDTLHRQPEWSLDDIPSNINDSPLLDAEIYQLQRFCAAQMSAFQVVTALRSLFLHLKSSGFKSNLKGKVIIPPLTQIAFSQCEDVRVSEILYGVYVENRHQHDAEKDLGLKGKKSWQILCREYCTIVLNQ